MVEMLVAVSVLLMLLAFVPMVVFGAGETFLTGATAERIQSDGRRALAVLADELRMADSATLLLLTENGCDGVSFRVPRGLEGNVPQWSTPIAYCCIPSTTDANGNGVADDLVLVRTQNGQTRLLCHRVGDGGLVVTRDGERLVLRLELSASDADGRQFDSTVETSVTPRNDTSGGS